MGDFRFSMTVKANFWGHEYTLPDCWWNWSPDETGCDRRVYEWFADCARDARAKYDEQFIEDRRAAEAAATEERERSELARLKAKYEP